MAVKGAEEDSDIELDPAARSERGVRDWLADLGGGGPAAAFDTRIDKSPALLVLAALSLAHGDEAGAEAVAATNREAPASAAVTRSHDRIAHTGGSLTGAIIKRRRPGDQNCRPARIGSTRM